MYPLLKSVPISDRMKEADFKDEFVLLEGLKDRNIHSYIRLYKEYSEDLLVLAYTLTGDPILASNAVDRLFTALYEKDLFMHVEPPLHHFLYSELRKYCPK
jgi:hypothetical protein